MHLHLAALTCHNPIKSESNSLRLDTQTARATYPLCSALLRGPECAMSAPISAWPAKTGGTGDGATTSGPLITRDASKISIKGL